MPLEIERKFLVDLNKIELPEKGHVIKQGYLETKDQSAVRIRVKNSSAFLTIKSKKIGAVRSEFEYLIPLEDGEQLLEEMCQKPFIEKIRYDIPYGDHLWEIDIFHGDNEGLCVAEIELTRENESFQKPHWIGDEVTDDDRYYNVNLMSRPFKAW